MWVYLWVQIPPVYKDTVILDRAHLDLTLTWSSAKTVSQWGYCIHRYWELDFAIFWGHTIQLTAGLFNGFNTDRQAQL